MKRIASFAVLAGLVIFGIYLFHVAYKGLGPGVPSPAPKGAKGVVIKKLDDLRARKKAWTELKKSLEYELRDFKGTAGLIVKDLDMDWEIQSNPDVLIPSASLVKIPIMLSYFYAAEEKKVDFNSAVRLGDYRIAPGSGLLKNESRGENFTIATLIELMITHSDNTAANILIDIFDMGKLNTYFRNRLGLCHTNLSRVMMDFRARKKGVENYTTARDMAHLLEKLYRGEFVNPTVSRQCLEVLAGQKVNDRIPKKLPPGTVVAHKTGLENGLCHDVGIVYTKKGNFLIAALTKHTNKYAQPAKKLISKISLLTYNYYNSF